MRAASAPGPRSSSPAPESSSAAESGDAYARGLLQAGTLGLLLPFFGVALVLSLLIAVHAVEPVV
jgi:hypothetical protein